MSEQQPPPSGAQPPALGQAMPPTYSASATSLAITANDIVLTLGHYRASFDGNNAQGVVVEWAASFAMGAPCAVGLRDSLNLALEQYEKRFGKIPRDPTTKLQTGGL